MEVQDTVSVTITLQTTATPVVSFNQLFLADTDDVPVDRRYLDVSKSSYASDLTSGQDPYNFATAFWSQSRTAQTLRIGRWVKTATEALAVGPDATQVASVYAALAATAQLKIVEGAANEDIAPDFTGDLTMADVCASIQAAMALGTIPAAYTCSLDNVGRIQIVSDNTGAAADTVSWTTPAAGIDLSLAAYLGASVSVAGLDAEEPSAALTAISALDDDYYDVAVRGESAAQQQTLAATIEALSKQLTLVTAVAGDKDPAGTTDVPYLLKALGYDRTSCIYTEHTINATGGWVDATTNGCVLPATAGTTSWANESLSATFESGKDSFGSPIPLTTSERNALEGKNCNYIVTTGGATFMRKGLNCSGEEKVTMIGVDFLQQSMQNDIFAYNINTPRAGFDDDTLAAYEKIIWFRLTEAKTRGFIVDTRDRPITVTMPTADDFTAAERASHTMTLDNVFSAYINSTVIDVVITGEFRI